MYGDLRWCAVVCGGAWCAVVHGGAWWCAAVDADVSAT